MGRACLERTTSSAAQELKGEGEACLHQAIVSDKCKDQLTVLGIEVY